MRVFFLTVLCLLGAARAEQGSGGVGPTPTLTAPPPAGT
ncbi:hypothetical protein Daqu01_03341 [Deinococcus aquaticus]